jgi:hypothetical protein
MRDPSLSRLEKRKRIWMAAGEANNSLECKCGVNEVLKGPPFITLAAHNSRWTQAGDELERFFNAALVYVNEALAKFKVDLMYMMVFENIYSLLFAEHLRSNYLITYIFCLQITSARGRFPGGSRIFFALF